MRIEFDDHQIVEANRAELGDASDVISSEVNEHHMFGPFLGIGKEFLGESTVLFGGLAPGASTGQGADRHDPIDDSSHDFWAAADKGAFGGSQQEHKGARVDDPQGSEDFDRFALALDFEALAQDDLEDIPGLDVLPAFQDGLLEAFFGEI